ncbi:MAG TPA: GntR family transcriptional regulator [Spirochaetia bacterium]|nr:GntR family transcriptional regulator [Spirochaetia bacterium]
MKYEEIYRELQQQFQQRKWKSGQRFPTERELADQYRVSRPTISRVVNRLRDAGQVRRVVGSGTFVIDAAEETTAHLTFGLFVPGLGRGEIFEPICARIAELSHEFNFTLVWGSVPANGPVDHEPHLMATAKRFIDHGMDGVFFQPVELESAVSTKNRRIVAMFEEAQIPIVLLDSDYLSYPYRSAHDLVGIDNIRAAYVLTSHMIEKGARRVDFLWQPHTGESRSLRVAGYRDALFSAGVPHLRDFEHEGDPRSLPFVRDLIDGGATDIICANDETAALLMLSFESLNVRVPGDVRIAGFDDVKYARLARVPLTTMSQPYRALGDLAVQTIIARIAQPALPPRTVTAEATLCARESTSVPAV